MLRHPLLKHFQLQRGGGLVKCSFCRYQSFYVTRTLHSVGLPFSRFLAKRSAWHGVHTRHKAGTPHSWSLDHPPSHTTLARLLGNLPSIPMATLSTLSSYSRRVLIHNQCGPEHLPVRSVLENPHYIKSPETFTTILCSEGFPSKAASLIEVMKLSKIYVSRTARKDWDVRDTYTVWAVNKVPFFPYMFPQLTTWQRNWGK